MYFFPIRALVPTPIRSARYISLDLDLDFAIIDYMGAAACRSACVDALMLATHDHVHSIRALMRVMWAAAACSYSAPAARPRLCNY